MHPILNKTMGPADLRRPEVRSAARALKKLALGMWLRRVPFAVNGVLRKRWYVRWHKLWEYSRGLAYGDFQRDMRVLDFGGAATLPILHLARLGCDILSLDISPTLVNHTNAVAAKYRWKLRASTLDLTTTDPPAEWGRFDRVISFCVLEHIPKALQQKTVRRLASLLGPGGLFELTFDFGENTPMEDAFRGIPEVRSLVAASGLSLMGNAEFVDTGERFAIDKNHPGKHFTFGSLFLRAAGPQPIHSGVPGKE